MVDSHVTRRQFMQTAATATAGLALGAPLLDGASAGAAPAAAPGQAAPAADEMKRTRSYCPQMQYRRLGKTGLWLSAVCLGGHWKRINQVVKNLGGVGDMGMPSGDATEFDQNRHDVVSRCIARGINYVDACTGGEVRAYAKALKGRREAMYLGYSFAEQEMRNGRYQTAKALLESLDEGLRKFQLEYVDLWRITLHEGSGRHTEAVMEEAVAALEQARKAGKCRAIGFSSHDRPHMQQIIEKYPQVEVLVMPYAVGSTELPKDSIFQALIKQDVGFIGIKPFGSGSLFRGRTPEENDARARLAIRQILCNPAVTAPIPGLISVAQVDNVAAAIKEGPIQPAEKAAVDAISRQMWASLPADYQWLHDWRCM